MALWSETGIVIHEIIMEIEKRKGRLHGSPHDWSYLGEVLGQYCESMANRFDDCEEEESGEYDEEEIAAMDEALADKPVLPRKKKR